MSHSIGVAIAVRFFKLFPEPGSLGYSAVVAPFMRVMPHHLVPMPRLMDVGFAVHTSSYVLGPLVFREAILTPVRSFFDPGVVEFSSSSTIWVLAQVAKLIDSLIHIPWPWVLLCHVVEWV